MIYPDDFIDKVILGDSLEVLKEIPDNSVDTIITDPPYGLAFMGKEWDSFGTDLQKFQEWTRSWASEVLRVAKPGAMLLVFGGTRTWHRLACGLEDAGWEIRDTLMWLYGSGFPKSLNIGKEVDKLQGNEREVVGKIDTKRLDYIHRIRVEQGYRPNIAHASGIRTIGFSEWEGYGTNLKPAYEPIILAMKPLDGTFAENALKWGVAGLNIDEARIETGEDLSIERTEDRKLDTKNQGWGFKAVSRGNQGRFPANILLDEVSAEMLDEQSGNKRGQLAPTKGNEPSTLRRGNIYGDYSGYGKPSYTRDGLGGASRFFYVAKVSRSERNAGLEDMPEKVGGGLNATVYGDRRNGRVTMQQNNHPTVKPIKLMDYLVKLTKMPNPNQIYLDPFLGSGTTAIAVVLNGRHFIGIEKEPEYVEIAKKRIEYWSKEAKNEMF